MDLTPSDIAAGLLLLRRQQEEELVVSEATGSLQTTSDPPAWLEMTQVRRGMQFALACYGWPVFVMMNMCRGGCCALCGLCR